MRPGTFFKDRFTSANTSSRPKCRQPEDWKHTTGTQETTTNSTSLWQWLCKVAPTEPRQTKATAGRIGLRSVLFPAGCRLRRADQETQGGRMFHGQRNGRSETSKLGMIFLFSLLHYPLQIPFSYIKGDVVPAVASLWLQNVRRRSRTALLSLQTHATQIDISTRSEAERQHRTHMNAPTDRLPRF